MKKTIRIQPRQTGKTTASLFEFMKHPNSSIIVTNNQNMVKHIHSMLNGLIDLNGNYYLHLNNIISEEQFIKIRGKFKNYHTFIFDEYMFFKNKKDVYELTYTLEPKEISIYTTSNKLYDAKLVDYVKQFKIDRDPSNINQYSDKLVDELYYNFITDPDSVIKDGLTMKYHESYNYLDKNEYRVEILNQYLFNLNSNSKYKYLLTSK